ncbi:hypothetical protein [Kitasatospora sp. DSM 101779]|uniref:hypothetical protein n=1 Tax=Kitasatospora sp. DSM 101779 TaxID=2853165 RepID=UPI0021D8A586|nr:hypothetical protein [Kitasatospora sp. DSM 101779]MCU7822126.1 hypothetical protein [Kitasatospora sp. DSM 101779]
MTVTVSISTGPTASGLVLGHAGAAGAARAHAAALGRPFRPTASRQELVEAVAAAAGTPAFVLAPEAELDLGLTGELAETGRAHAVRLGVLPLPPDPAAAARLLDRSARAAGAGPRHPHRTLHYCDFRREPVPGPRHSYGSDSSDEFIARLVEGAEAVVLHGHGNGADFRVGRHVLCLQADLLRPAPGHPGEQYLPCQGGGPCRLEHKTGFRAFHGAGAVRSRLLVLLSCSAWQPSGGLLGPRFQLARRLLDGPHLAGFVASTRINHGTPQLGAAVERLLDTGAPLGEVALRINLLAGEGLASYVCVGDPELRIPAGAATTKAPAAGTRTAARGTARPAPVPAAPSVAVAVADTPGPDDPRAARRLVQSRIVRRAVAAGDRPAADLALADRLADAALQSAPDGELDHLLCKFLGATLARRGPDVHDYLSGSVGYSPEEPTGLRHHCGHRLLRLRIVPRDLPAGALALYVCERCGSAHTLPPGGEPPRAVLGPDTLTLHLPRPLTAGGRYTAARQPIGGHPEPALPVAELAAGAREVTVPLPRDGAPGLRRIAVALVADGEFSVHQLPLTEDRSTRTAPRKAGRPCWTP